MNVEKLSAVFENFKRDNNRAILVDGPWGVGKTYQILQFLKKDIPDKNKKENRMVYVSLFGKTTIDEIHTDIYSKLHPVKSGAKKVVQVIPKVAPLLGTVGNMISNMEFALNTDESKLDSLGKGVAKTAETIKKVTEELNAIENDQHTKTIIPNRIIVILDDLERMNSQNISFGDLLGYINNLFLQNIKVIVICNSKEIKDPHFTSFKEKVFDREYKITSAKEEIINAYFGEYSEFLKDYIVKEFDNNLRIALRVSTFHREVVKKLNAYNKKYYEKISNETVLYYCTLVVVGCNSNKYLDAQAAAKGKNYLMFESSEDDHIQTIAQSIYDYVRNNDTSEYINETLIFGFLEGYYYNTYDRVRTMISETIECEDPFLKDPFYMSDNEKADLFTKQFEKIKNDSEIADRNIQDVLQKMCLYEEFSRINDREDEIIENLLKKCVERELYVLMDFPLNNNQRFVTFTGKVKNAYKQNKITIMVDRLNHSYANRKFAELCDCLTDLERKVIFNENHVLNSDVLKTLKSNGYFIGDLFNTIDYALWQVACTICEIAVRYNFAEEVVTYIKSIDFSKDKSAEGRYMSLLKKLTRKKG